MRASVLTVTVLLGMIDCGAHADSLAGFGSDPVLLNAPNALETLREARIAGDTMARAAQPLPDAPAPYSNAMARFDPANFKVFGAEIGGDGVQGGAVISLSWPTAH